MFFINSAQILPIFLFCKKKSREVKSQRNNKLNRVVHFGKIYYLSQQQQQQIYEAIYI